MKSLLHIVRTRRNILLLVLFAILSQVFFLRMISYNSEKRRAHELELQHSYKVIQDIENIRYSLAESESAIQSYMLTGDHQWKGSLGEIHGRIFRVLDQAAEVEADPMQQRKFTLVKQAVQNKIAFQQQVVTADSITPALMAGMAYHGLNRRLTQRIQSPLSLIVDRQQLLLQRRTDAGVEAANQARLLTIFYAAFIYLFILYALWQLRKQIQQPGPSTVSELQQQSNSSSPMHSGFRGVFPMNDEPREDTYREKSGGIVRILWKRDQDEEEVDDEDLVFEEDLLFVLGNEMVLAKEMTAGIADQSSELPAWKAAGLPEKLDMHLHNGHDNFLGHAVNANYVQPGPAFNRQPNSFIPGGNFPYRVYPAPFLPETPVTRLPTQEQPGFQLSELVQSALAPFYSQAEEKNIRLLHTLDPSIPGSLPGSPDRLQKILTGLLDNAFRFTYKGYVQLTISALNITSEEAEIAFSVADTGRGIDSENMHELLHNSSNHGLGLAKTLVELQQNQMMIHSTPEDGTVCCFTSTFKLR